MSAQSPHPHAQPRHFYPHRALTSSFASAEQIKYERYQKVTYFCKDGTPKEKKDFVSVTVPFGELEKELREFWPQFIAHHNDAKWHDDDFASMRTMLQRGHVCIVIDFAENYTHEARFENQSKYFSQVCCAAVRPNHRAC